MRPNVDASVYPDRDAPTEFVTDDERAEYIHRVVSAFDFGVVPDEPTLALFSQWRATFDRFPLPTSSAYHALRVYFGWPPIDRLPSLAEPTYMKFDRLEGRIDPCDNAL